MSPLAHTFAWFPQFLSFAFSPAWSIDQRRANISLLKKWVKKIKAFTMRDRSKKLSIIKVAERLSGVNVRYDLAFLLLFSFVPQDNQILCWLIPCSLMSFRCKVSNKTGMRADIKITDSEIWPLNLSLCAGFPFISKWQRQLNNMLRLVILYVDTSLCASLAICCWRKTEKWHKIKE